MNFKRPMCLVHKSCEVFGEVFFPSRLEASLKGCLCRDLGELLAAATGTETAAPFSIQWHLKSIRRPIRDIGCHRC